MDAAVSWNELTSGEQRYLRFQAGLTESVACMTADVFILQWRGLLDERGIINLRGVEVLLANDEKPRWSPIGGWH